MPDYGDIRQRTILAIESQGADALTIIGDGISELQKKQRDLSGEFQAGGVAADGYIKKMQALEAEVAKLKAMYDEAGNSFDKMSDLQKKLGEMQKRSEAETRGAILDSAAARRAGTEAIVDHIAKTRQEIAADNEAAAAMDREHDELEALNKAFQNNVQNVGMATRATREQIQALKDMGIIADTTAPKIKKQGEEGQKAGQAAARGALEMSRAVEDFAVAGPLGALNNIPGIMYDVGQSFEWSKEKVAGVTAAISILATAAYVGYQQFGPIAKDMARDWGLTEDATRKLTTSVEVLQEKLEILKSKKFKVEFDYDQIDEAERLLEVMQARLNAFNSGRKDNLSEEMGRQAKEATHSYAGGTGGLYKAVYETEKTSGISHADQNDIDKLKTLQGQISSMADTGFNPTRDMFKKEAAELAHKIEQANRDWAQQEVGAFETGDPLAVQRMQARARQTPGAFARAGPGGVTAGEAIANLPSTPEEMLRRINQEEDQKRNDESMAEFVQQNRRAGQKAKAGAKTSEDAEERHHANIHGEFEQGLAEFRAKSEKMQAAIDLKAGGTREQRVSAGAQRFGPGFDEALEQARLGHAAGGMGADASAARLQPQLAARLKGNGVPADIVDDVAKQILAKALDKVANQINEEMMGRNMTAPEAARGLRNVARDKFAAEDVTNQRRADAPFVAGQAAEKQQQRAYMAQLKTQALMESTMGIVGPAMQELSQIEAMNQMLQSKVRGMSKMQQRGGMQNRTFVPNFGG